MRYHIKSDAPPEARPPVPGGDGLRTKPSRSYHHGDLRTALIEEARDALKTAPSEAVTLKALAERLGVSQPAPYRHFSSRDALMRAVAADGFRRFREELMRAVEAPADDRFARGCQAYLDFAARNFGVYRLMFSGRHLAEGADLELASASAAAFAVLLAAVSSGAAEAEARPTAIALWAALHGMALLASEGLLEGPEPRPGGAPDTSDLVQELVRRFAPAATRAAG